MINQGSGIEIMYPDLFKGFGLRLEDLSKYDVPLVGFDGNTIIPKGMIRPTRADRRTGGECGFHCRGGLFTLYSHSSKAVAPY